MRVHEPVSLYQRSFCIGAGWCELVFIGTKPSVTYGCMTLNLRIFRNFAKKMPSCFWSVTVVSA